MSTLIDADAILSGIEQWQHLERQWGTPVDLDADDEHRLEVTTVPSTWDLVKSTFDSSCLLKKVKRELSKKSVDYDDFLQDLRGTRMTSEKQFYFISGQIISAASVEAICDDIDDIFRSVTQLCSATSTVRVSRAKPKPSLPEVVGCSFSASGLSFDETEAGLDLEKEKGDSDDVDRFIDEVFGHLDATLTSLSNDGLDASVKESVTTLVWKFTAVLKSPGMKCSPRRRRQYCDRFKELTNFWQSEISDHDEM